MAFDATLEVVNGIGKITLSGELDASVAATLKTRIEEAAAQNVRRLVLMLDALEYMSSAGLRTLVFAKQKMGQKVDIFIVGAQPQVVSPIKDTGFHHSVIMLDTYDAAKIEA
ncbi:MAG: anti-sigma factor antagonist [Chloroflexota bacterium]|nr:anti-sigma factor antagonist [Chloroflexota bacterium]